MRTGDVVEDFELPDQHGAQRRLTDLLAGGTVVCFFYPAAMTPGCTAQSCHFRDLAAEFAELGAQRVGISADEVDKQANFASKYDFDYPLLSDSDGVVAAQFGVKRRFGPLPVKRSTFVIGEDRRLLAAFRSEFRMSAHADEALEILRQHQTA